MEFKGTGLGANGKGVSKEFARASGYAELFERYQNDMMGPRVTYGDKLPFLYAADERIMSSKEIASQDNAFIHMYFSQRGIDGSSVSKKAQAFRNLQKVDSMVYGLEDSYVTLPFYSMRNHKVVYLPKSTYNVYYGSNGMCAGNTSAEAIVQGISEILERVVQTNLFVNMPSLPDVPRAYIKRFPEIDERLSLAENNKDYRVSMKLCSRKYPVAGLVVTELNTGRFGIKLGCHPDFGIAMERCMTEATQGQDFFDYTDRSTLDFSNENVRSSLNIYNSFKFGMGKYPYQLFRRCPSFEFDEPVDVSRLSNEKQARHMIDSLLAQGWDVLIRDVSYFGFPSYHIIIPGLSEMQKVTDAQFRATNTRYFVANLLNNKPEEIHGRNADYVIGVMNYFLGNAFENTMASYYGIAREEDLPAESINGGCMYMIAMCHLSKCEYEKSVPSLKVVVKHADKLDSPDAPWYRAVLKYAEAMEAMGDHDEVIGYLRMFFTSDICDRLDRVFVNPAQIVMKQYPGVVRDGETPYERYRDIYDRISNIFYTLKQTEISADISQRDPLPLA